jgi:hypothetical protein
MNILSFAVNNNTFIETAFVKITIELLLIRNIGRILEMHFVI